MSTIPESVIRQVLAHAAPKVAGPKRGEAIFEGVDYPRDWSGFIGQEEAKEELRVAVASAVARDTRLDHTLFASGIAGVGKSTLATLAAYQAGRGFLQTSGPLSLSDFRNLVRGMQDGDILFHDELHTLVAGNKNRADWVLPFLVEGKLYTDRGAEKVPDISFWGATTDPGKLPATILSRFMCTPTIERYTLEEGGQICGQLAERMKVSVPADVLEDIARAADINPRVMRKIISKIRDLSYAYPETHPEPGTGVQVVGGLRGRAVSDRPGHPAPAVRGARLHLLGGHLEGEAGGAGSDRSPRADAHATSVGHDHRARSEVDRRGDRSGPRGGRHEKLTSLPKRQTVPRTDTYGPGDFSLPSQRITHHRNEHITCARSSSPPSPWPPSPSSASACDTLDSSGPHAFTAKNQHGKQNKADNGPAAKPKPHLTAAQANAVGAAQDYLGFKGFSRAGLIDQLSSKAGDGYKLKDATFAVDHIKVDWNKEAVKSAKDYLDFTHFSRSGSDRPAVLEGRRPVHGGAGHLRCEPRGALR